MVDKSQELNSEFQNVFDYILDKSDFDKSFHQNEKFVVTVSYENDNVGADFNKMIGDFEGSFPKSNPPEYFETKLKINNGGGDFITTVYKTTHKGLEYSYNISLTKQLELVIILLDIFDANQKLLLDEKEAEQFNAYLNSSIFILDYSAAKAEELFPFIKKLRELL